MVVPVGLARRACVIATLLFVIASPRTIAAQRAPLASDQVTLGDQRYAAADAAGALRHYEAAIASDPVSYDALWKAAHAAVDLGEYDPNARERDRLYTLAEQYARRSVERNPE
ncbi:MAG: hypothetical protein H0W68_12060, partial [Gemmatimonadaceae bacterium]|nr:hypothetical protein [Gemmatimonadaceae bacterium]